MKIFKSDKHKSFRCLYKYLTVVLCILGPMIFTGCLSEPTQNNSVAVIDGWLSSEGYPVVIFTASMIPGEEDTSIADKIIRWGKVTISDGEDTVIMTGGPDSKYFPPYKYYTFNMRGEPGKTYSITAEYENYKAASSCVMLSPTPIKEVRLTPIEGNDTLRSAQMYFVAPEDSPAFYYITIRDEKKGGRPLPALMGTVKTLKAGETINVPVFNPKNRLDTAEYVPQLAVGQNLEISLCRVTEDVYNFWVGYDNAVIFGGTQFINSDAPMEGNIEGGYGVWSVQGVSSYYLEVK